jgi:uncharacterized membrane protein YdjX (TVP38/TMEM64 family)
MMARESRAVAFRKCACSPVVLLVIFVVGGVCALWALLPMTEYLFHLSEWVQGEKIAGLVAFLAVSITWNVVLLPTTPTYVLWGFIFGAYVS